MKTLSVMLLFMLFMLACGEEKKATSSEVVNVVKNEGVEESILEDKKKGEETKIENVVSNLVDTIVEPIKDKIKVAVVEIPKPVKKEKKYSKITFKEDYFNFGKLTEGDVIEHSFKFRNTGEANLNIKNVTASCGCTQPSFPFLPIEPGETGAIDVTYNSKGKVNLQKPTITVYTNGKPRKIVLKMEGTVLPK